MTNYVFDTHALLWALGSPKRLRAGAKRAFRDIEQLRAVGWIPAVVIAEVAMLHELGRTSIGLSRIRSLLNEGGQLRFLPLDLQQVEHFAALSTIRDPFDRFIAAASRALDAILVSRDEGLAESGLVQVVWG